MSFCWLAHQSLTTLNHPPHWVGPHPQGRTYPYPCHACSGALCSGFPSQPHQMGILNYYCKCMMYVWTHICAEYVWWSGTSLRSQFSPPPLPWVLGFNSGLIGKRFTHWTTHWRLAIVPQPSFHDCSEEPKTFHILFILTCLFCALTSLTVFKSFFSTRALGRGKKSAGMGGNNRG